MFYILFRGTIGTKVHADIDIFYHLIKDSIMDALDIYTRACLRDYIQISFPVILIGQ